jgi:hypothetical protein
LRENHENAGRFGLHQLRNCFSRRQIAMKKEIYQYCYSDMTIWTRHPVLCWRVRHKWEPAVKRPVDVLHRCPRVPGLPTNFFSTQIGVYHPFRHLPRSFMLDEKQRATGDVG